MRKFATRNEIIVGLLLALGVLVGTAYAAIPSFRAASLRLTGASASGTAGTAANPTLWADTTTQPNLRFGDGTADRYVPACTPTTNGDICSWNGTNWARSAGGGVAAPLALAPATDATKGLTVQYHSATQSADPIEVLNATGTAIGGFAPIGSGLGTQLFLHSGATGGNALFDFSQGDGNTWKCILASGAIQCASVSGVWQWFIDGSYSSVGLQVDTNGVTIPRAKLIFPDSTTQATAAVTPLFKGMTAVNSVTTGETDAQSYTMPANTMSVDGQKIVFDAAWTHAANTNSTTYRFYVNGTALTAQTRTGSGELDTNNWICVRATSTTMRCTGNIVNGTASAVTVSSLTGINYAASMIIKTTVQGATANGDLTGNYMRGDLYP